MSHDTSAPNSLTLRSLDHTVRPPTAQELLLGAHELCTTARQLLQGIKKGDFEDTQALCAEEGLDRDSFLKIPAGSLVPAAAWARFVKSWFGQQILRLPHLKIADQQTQLIDRWLSRAEALTTLDTTMSRAQAVECLDCAIDALLIQPQSKHGELRMKLIAAYSQRGHLLQSFGDPEYLEHAIAAFDQAINLAKEDEDTLPISLEEDPISSLLHTYQALQTADLGGVDGPKEVRIQPRALKPLRKESHLSDLVLRSSRSA